MPTGTTVLNKDEAIAKARKDIAERIGVRGRDIEVEAVEDADFPDAALGAGTDDEMSAQMITPGWRIRLRGHGQSLEYRANKHQVRLYKYKGKNYRV